MFTISWRMCSPNSRAGWSCWEHRALCTSSVQWHGNMSSCSRLMCFVIQVHTAAPSIPYNYAIKVVPVFFRNILNSFVQSCFHKLCTNTPTPSQLCIFTCYCDVLQEVAVRGRRRGPRLRAAGGRAPRGLWVGRGRWGGRWSAAAPTQGATPEWRWQWQRLVIIVNT